MVRAWPNRLHIRDLDSYNQCVSYLHFQLRVLIKARIYKSGTKFDKDSVFYDSVLVEHSLFNMTDRSAAKIRKDMFQPYFSKGAIQRLESMIKGKIAQFLTVLDGASSGDKAMDLSLGFSCLTADVVMQYCNQKPLGALDAPDFQFPPILHISELFDTAPFAWYFPNVLRMVTQITAQLPVKFVERYMPPVAAMAWVQTVSRPFRDVTQPTDFLSQAMSRASPRTQVAAKGYHNFSTYDL